MADQQQSNIKQESNVARTGMNMDQSLNQVQQGQLTYALNAAVENFDSNSVNYQNEPGNELCLNFPEDYHLIGEHAIVEQNKHIFFLTNPNTGASEIGYMDNNDCLYHTYISGVCLNFNINYPIHKAVHKITNCTTEVYWTDGLNPRRYLDLNNLPYKIAPGTNVCENETIPELDCNKLKVQPNFTIPELTVTNVVNGGNLIAGTYQFAIQYCDAVGDAYTSYYSVTNPTPIAITTNTTADFNYPVGRSIVLDINNIDVTGYFKYYNLAVIKTVNDITSVELVGTYFIDDGFNQITYSGQNQTQIRLTINDIFEKFPYYEIAQDLTAVQDVLVWDNITSIDRINYQQIANQIGLQWQTYKLPADENYADPINATNLRGYLRDEVYAFEIVFLLDNGKQTDGFHIPGRIKNFNEFDYPDVPNTNPDFIGSDTSSPYWKIYNTASVLGTTTGESIGSATPYQYGEFAYWESTDVYPCNEDVWGDLANTPIRHHKFPDVLVSPIFESGTPTVAYDGTYTNLEMKDAAIYPIGVRFDVQQVYQLVNSSNLTQDQKDSIIGFKIVRGNRSTNTSIVAKGILRNLGEYEREGTSYYFPNYPYNDLREDPFLLKENNAFDAVCREYIVTITAASTTVTYYSCDTGLIIETIATVGQVLNICSTNFPTFTADTDGTVTATNYGTYNLCTNASAAGNRFSYFPPDKADPQVIWVSGNLFSQNCEAVDSITKPIQIEGSGRYTITLIAEYTGTLNCTVSVDQLDAFDNVRSPYRFVFNSPETSFGKPFLGNILKLENAIYGAGSAHFSQVQKNAMYKLITEEAQRDALKSSEEIADITTDFNPTAMFTAYQAYLQIYINGITRKNYARSYNSIAKYNYSAPINNNLGVKQRELDLYQYLIPGVQNVGDNLNINNFNRESSVYLKTIALRNASILPNLPYPSNTPSLLVGGITPAIEDKSRFTISEQDNCLQPENEFDITTVTYYASLKNIAANQWGQMYSYETIDTGFQNLLVEQASIGIVFGGDTFINKFSFKTKLPFFIDNRVGAPDDSDVFYDEIGNVAYPKYWHSARSILFDYTTTVASTSSGLPTTMKNIISIKAHNFDCPNSQAEGSPGRTFYDGSFYLFAYGIPTFYCETSVNVDLRQAFNNREGDFFPHVSTGIPDNWLQESFVPIAQDNTYYYNTTFSKQNKENFFSHLPIDWTNQLCYTNFPFRAIYSDRQQSYTDNRINSWLIYRPISFFDFPQNYGDLVSLDGIQNRAVLARFENKSLLYNTLLTVETSNPQAAYLGNDTLFRSAPPIDFAETDLGYVGCQNKMLLKIPQGQVTVDAKRGQVFLITGNQATDLSAFGSGLNRFFTDHLAFEILRYFPDKEEIIDGKKIIIPGVDVDNHFNGIGLHGVYDSKYDRIIISKLDYIPQNSSVLYDSVLQKFYVNRVLGESTLRQYVNLTDVEYFCSKSWTLSFNFNTKSWTSFHSYIPNWYVAENNFFYSGLNGGCDLEAIAVEEVPIECDINGSATLQTTTSTSTTSTTTTSTSTTSTTTTAYVLRCNIGGSAVPQSYNCTDGACIRVAGTSGTYPTKLACTSDCAIAPSWDCIDGDCIDPLDGLGTYSSLSACEAACTTTTTTTTEAPVTTYNCVDGSCVAVSGSSGTYATLSACNSACGTTYNCVDGTCTGVTGNSGTYATLSACQDVCEKTYNCTSGGCVEVSGNSGTYSTLAACQDVCKSYNCTSEGCVELNNNTGTYTTLSACQNECKSYDCDGVDCLELNNNTGTFATAEACGSVCGCSGDSYNITNNGTTSVNWSALSCPSGNAVGGTVSGFGGETSTGCVTSFSVGNNGGVTVTVDLC